MKTKNYLMGSVTLLVVVSGMLYGGQRRQPVRKAEQHNGEKHSVTTNDGKTIVVTAEGKVFKLDVPDGAYQLTNGGAIRVRGGKVVWDAFGAVKRLKAGRWRGGSIDPTG